MHKPLRPTPRHLPTQAPRNRSLLLSTSQQSSPPSTSTRSMPVRLRPRIIPRAQAEAAHNATLTGYGADGFAIAAMANHYKMSLIIHDIPRTHREGEAIPPGIKTEPQPPLLPEGEIHLFREGQHYKVQDPTNPRVIIDAMRRGGNCFYDCVKYAANRLNPGKGREDSQLLRRITRDYILSLPSDLFPH